MDQCPAEELGRPKAYGPISIPDTSSPRTLGRFKQKSAKPGSNDNQCQRQNQQSHHFRMGMHMYCPLNHLNDSADGFRVM
jgi:hypothetical protein